MEYSLLYHAIIPFALSALVVILVTIIAEKYGTKTGGVIGTLPSTIIIAFLFIALDKGTQFASDSVAVVPAEMGINLVFLLLFALLSQKKILVALAGSLFTWTVLTIVIYYSNLTSITLSLAVYLVCFLLAFLILDKKKKITSQDTIKVHYTALKLLGRSLIAGIVIAIAVSFSNVGVLLSRINDANLPPRTWTTIHRCHGKRHDLRQPQRRQLRHRNPLSLPTHRHPCRNHRCVPHRPCCHPDSFYLS
jgi:uncharacterized membrane protein (GlpM family)